MQGVVGTFIDAISTNDIKWKKIYFNFYRNSYASIQWNLNYILLISEIFCRSFQAYNSYEKFLKRYLGKEIEKIQFP